jgi:methylated-DNA-[protein]-cysteine S-methyltransferase
MNRYSLVPSPLGEILLAFDDDALTGLYFVGQKDEPAVAADWRRDDGHPIARSVSAQLLRYFDGGGARFDVPLRLEGTDFRRRVWQVLREIPAGRTICYGDVAARVGLPAAVRAVGTAIGRNPVSIIVPCHRVIGRDGTLTGYAGGLHRKRYLLQLEGVA